MSIARSYAKALHEALTDAKAPAGEVEAIEQHLETLTQLVDGSRDLHFALVGPATSVKEKVSIVTELSKKLGGPRLFTQFIQLLAKKKRLALLAEIREAFSVVKLESQGGLLGRLESADALSAADVESLSKAFSQKVGRKVAFNPSVDASLLAGVKVTVGGVTYDGTLKAQLRRLRDKMVFGTSSASH